MKKLRVTVEGKVYEVLVEILDETAAAAPLAAPAPVAPVAALVSSPPPQAAPRPAAPTASAGAGDIPSPLAGKIVSVEVKVGDSVAEGAQVATIEAMKMNTYIFAPKAGRVEAVLVSAGDGVEEGTVLLRIA